jgi:hypothetical protein
MVLPEIINGCEIFDGCALDPVVAIRSIFRAFSEFPGVHPAEVFATD